MRGFYFFENRCSTHEKIAFVSILAHNHLGEVGRALCRPKFKERKKNDILDVSVYLFALASFYQFLKISEAIFHIYYEQYHVKAFLFFFFRLARHPDAYYGM